MNISIITNSRQKAWGVPRYKFRTNSNHEISVIEYQGGYEIVVFDPHGDSNEPIWMATIDEMIQSFSALVAKHTVGVEA